MSLSCLTRSANGRRSPNVLDTSMNQKLEIPVSDPVPDGQPNEAVSDGEQFLFYVLLGLVSAGMAGVLLVLCLLNKSQPAATTSPVDDISRPMAPDRPRHLTDFSLVNWTGATISQADLRGKYVVVDFLFTGCSLTCPVVNSYMADIQRFIAGSHDVKLVSITVNPRDDTPSVLAKYAARFGADSNCWYFLTGDRDEVYQLIKTSFLNQDLDPSFGYMPGNFSHTDRIAIVGPDGAVRAYFDGLNQNTPAAVTNEIAELRREQR